MSNELNWNEWILQKNAEAEAEELRKGEAVSLVKALQVPPPKPISSPLGSMAVPQADNQSSYDPASFPGFEQPVANLQSGKPVYGFNHASHEKFSPEERVEAAEKIKARAGELSQESKKTINNPAIAKMLSDHAQYLDKQADIHKQRSEEPAKAQPATQPAVPTEKPKSRTVLRKPGTHFEESQSKPKIGDVDYSKPPEGDDTGLSYVWHLMNNDERKEAHTQSKQTGSDAKYGIKQQPQETQEPEPEQEDDNPHGHDLRYPPEGAHERVVNAWPQLSRESRLEVHDKAHGGSLTGKEGRSLWKPEHIEDISTMPLEQAKDHALKMAEESVVGDKTHADPREWSKRLAALPDHKKTLLARAKALIFGNKDKETGKVVGGSKNVEHLAQNMNNFMHAGEGRGTRRDTYKRTSSSLGNLKRSLEELDNLFKAIKNHIEQGS